MATFDLGKLNTAFPVNFPGNNAHSTPSIYQAPAPTNGAGGGGGGSWGPTGSVTPTVTPVSPTPTAGVTTGSVPNPGESIAETYARGQAVLNGLPPIPGASPTTPTAGSTASILGSDIYGSDPGTIDQYQEAPNEEAIRRQQMQLFQGQIDATNQAYDEILNNERLAGQGRLGTQRAMGARGGILGSDFSSAQKTGTEQFNSAQQRGIAAERSAKIGAILGEVRSSVATEIKAKNDARKQGYDAHVAYLAGGDERKSSNAQKAASAILQAGLDPSQMDPAELAAIGKEAGLSTEEIIYAYGKEKSAQTAAQTDADRKDRKTEAEIAKIEADIASGKLKTVGEGTMLLNTETGETFKNPKTYAPKDGTTPGVDKMYTSKDIPGNVRADLLDDIAAGQTEEQLLNLYPEVNLETIQEYYGQFAPTEDSGSWWNFWGG